MFTVYILYSKIKDCYYVGYTSNVSARLIRHNQYSKKGFTGNANDWDLLYHEDFLLKSDALAREKEIKKWKSRKMIIELISKNN